MQICRKSASETLHQRLNFKYVRKVICALGQLSALARLSGTTAIERTPIGWPFDTSNNLRKVLPRDFFNTIGRELSAATGDNAAAQAALIDASA